MVTETYSGFRVRLLHPSNMSKISGSQTHLRTGSDSVTCRSLLEQCSLSEGDSALESSLHVLSLSLSNGHLFDPEGQRRTILSEIQGRLV